MLNLKKKFLILSTAFLLQSCYYASQNETLESKIFGKNYAQETNEKTSRRVPEGNQISSEASAPDTNKQNFSTNSNVKLSSNDYDAYQHYQATTPPKKAKRRPILNLKELNELMDREATISLKERADSPPEISAESNLNEVIEYNKAKKKEYKKPKKKVKVLVVKKDKNETTKEAAGLNNNVSEVKKPKQTIIKKNNNVKSANSSTNNSSSAQADTAVVPTPVNTNNNSMNQAAGNSSNNKPNASYVSPVATGTAEAVSTSNSAPNNQMSNKAAKQPEEMKSMVLPPVSVPTIPAASIPTMPIAPVQAQAPVTSNAQTATIPAMPPVPNLNEQRVNAPDLPPIPVMPPAGDSQKANEEMNNSIQDKLNDKSEQNSNSSNEEANRFAPPMPPVPGAEESSIFDLDSINKFLLDIYYSIKFTILAMLKSWFRFD